MSAVDDAIEHALDYLKSQQRPDGGLDSYSSVEKHDFVAAYTYQTVFVPALVLQSLSWCDLPSSLHVRERLADFLLSQKGQHGSYNYWAVNSPERKTFPYPDDLDDTFCTLIALHSHDQSHTDGVQLALMVKLLVAVEQQPGGPYRTWLVTETSDKAWQDVDVAVNANIACFLDMIGSPLPSLSDYLGSVIVRGKLTSPYYPTVYPLLYYLARTYKGSDTPRLVELLLSLQKNGHWGTPLQTALAAVALQQLQEGTEVAKALVFLLESQQPDGSWPAEAFCMDPTRRDQEYYHGAAVLTTAIVIEALCRQNPELPEESERQPDVAAERLYEVVSRSAKEELGVLCGSLGELGVGFANQLLNGDKKHEITLLPYYFAQSLVARRSIDPGVFVPLGMATFYGWMAYTIYDDFLDDEGDPKLLSVANVALRNSLLAFRRVVPGRTFQEYVTTVFNRIDAANTWEVTHCRFGVTEDSIEIGKLPDYGDRHRLADRSLGHALSPLALLALLHYSPQTSAAKMVEQALSNYLIGRQMSDDLHDWEEDFQAGRISYVVTAILADLKTEPGTHSFKDLLPKMQRQFWYHTIVMLCQEADEHLRAAQVVPKLLKQPNIMQELTRDIQKTIDTTRTKQKEATDFLETYAT